MLALVCPALREAKGDVEVSVDFFYNNISGGSWIEVGDYGYCWQPEVAVSNSNWRPYSDGYWAYTDVGWTWVSYEDFGWATYHYGRWVRLQGQGWVWAPGRDSELEWGPAWVSWRTGGDHIGWAPLPPEVIVSSGGITGHLDVEFDIGPEYYNFVDVRYIGEPVLRERIIAPSQNITYIQQTVNVTNITYKNKTVYNYGPNIDVVNKTSTRPIQRLRLERQQNVDFSTAAKSGDLTKVQGDKLMVGAPMHVKKSAQAAPPPRLKTKVEKANVDRGWAGVGDEKARTEFKQKIKSQDLKNVPPPTGARAAGQAAATAPPVGPGAVSEDKNVGDKTKQDRKSAMPSTDAPAVGGSSATTGAEGSGDAATGLGRGKGKHNRPGDGMQTDAAASAGAATSSSDAAGIERERQKGKQVDQFRKAPITGRETAAPSGMDQTTAPGDAVGGGKRNRKGMNEGNAGQLQGQGQPADASAVQGQGQDQGNKARRLEGQGRNAGPGNAAEMQGQGGGGKQRQGEGRALGQPAGGERPQGQGQGQGQGEGRGKKNKDKAPEAVPAATP